MHTGSYGLSCSVSSAIRSSVNREDSTSAAAQNGTDQAVPPNSTELSSASGIPEQSTPTMAAEPQAARPFSFFRAYRFPSRSLPEVAGIPALPLHRPAPLSAPAGNTTQASTEAPNDSDQMQIDQPTPQTIAPTAVTPNIVPMLFVGVRSAASSALADFSSSFGATPSATQQGSTTSAPNSDSVSRDSEMRDASTQTPSSNAPEENQESQSDAPRTHGFVLWIFGGLYPATHPVVLAPSLLGDEAMSYEEMMRLADIIGQHKPPTVSKQEIAEAGLEVIKGSAVKTAEAEGNVRSITADRCLSRFSLHFHRGTLADALNNSLFRRLRSRRRGACS